MTLPIKVEIFTDFVCPWCYLNTPRIEKLRRNYDIDVQWVYFPLHPDTPAEGLALAELFAGRAMDLDAAQARLKIMMEAEGLQFNERRYTYNSRLAQELAKAYDILRDALYKAYFEGGKNIGNIEVLVALAESAGISADAARRVLADRTFKAAVDADWEKARQYGITGVPSIVAGGRVLSGAHPYDVLEKFVIATGGDSPQRHREHRGGTE